MTFGEFACEGEKRHGVVAEGSPRDRICNVVDAHGNDQGRDKTMRMEFFGVCPRIGRGDTGVEGLALSRRSPVRAQWERWKLPRKKASVENKIE